MATQDPTENYAWPLPNVGGDSGNWGAMIRDLIGDDVTGIDAVVKAISVIANAALPKAGGTMTGALKVFTEHYTVSNMGAINGAEPMDLSITDVFYGTLTGTATISFTNVPATTNAVFWTLELTNGGVAAITWPAEVKWPGGAPPTLTASGVDIITFYTRDGGTTVYASVAMLDLS